MPNNKLLCCATPGPSLAFPEAFFYVWLLIYCTEGCLKQKAHFPLFLTLEPSRARGLFIHEGLPVVGAGFPTWFWSMWISTPRSPHSYNPAGETLFPQDSSLEEFLQDFFNPALQWGAFFVRAAWPRAHLSSRALCNAWKSLLLLWVCSS